MSPEERIWWEELADQYEEWLWEPPLYEPPFFSYSSCERYTCGALDRGNWGWGDKGGDSYSACQILRKLWVPAFGDTFYPAGYCAATDRPERRRAFCLYMSETIREYLKTGRFHD